MWDEFIERHFREWAKGHLPGNQMLTAEMKLRKFTTAYPDLLEAHSWREMLDMIERNEKMIGGIK